MKLSRDAIQRMVEAGGGSGGGGGLSQSQIDAMLAGYAQRSWVDKNYLSIEFFSSIFRIHSTEAGGDNDLIEPNSQLPQDTSHVNIEAMFGFWTDLYISAMGKSPTGQPASLFLSSLGDVAIPSPQDGQVLTFNSGMWVAQTPASGVDMAQVWAAMAAVDASKQIDISHLSNALSNFLNVKEGGTVEKPVTFQDTVDMGSTLAVTGAVTMGSTLAVTGDITMGSKLVATQEWANNTFVMKSWFDQIFQVFNDQTKIAVNGDLPQDKSKMNIQAMFGFWTELYVSALGKSPDGQASLFLSSLGDVSIPNPANGQVLTYDSASGKWVALTPASSTDMAAVWANLAASDSSHQIDYSHLSGAISINNGTITIGSQSIPVLGNFLPIAGGTLTGTLTGTKFHSNANSSIDLTHIPSDSEIALETGDGSGGVSAWIWREQYSSSNWGIFHDNYYDVIHFVGNSTSRFSINLTTGDVKVGTNDVIHSGNIASQSVNYATSAGSATSADSTSSLDYSGTGVNNVTAYQTLDSFMGRSGWGSYLIFNHGDGATYYSQTICMPFWGSPLYRRLEGGTDQGWKAFITEENIASQSVNYATSAGSADYATSAGYASSAGDAATLGGTAKSGLFTSLTSTWATNMSATIGGTTLSVSSLNADYAGQLRYTRSIWGQNFNGTADVSGDLYLAGSNLRLFDYNNSADCYIVGYRTGSSRAIGVAVEGSSLFEFNDEEFYSAVGIYAASYVTALSDIRYKNVIRHFALDAETIANASLIQFKWIDGRDQATHVGGIAQEWQAFLPEAVHETKDGKLSMDYGVIAYTAAVSLAKKVIAQQQEIDDLKQRLERLERIIDKVTK